MRFGSICSGIEAASVAWNPLGWKAAWFSEIEPFPSALLAYHYPDTPNLGDMTALPQKILNEEIEAPELICGVRRVRPSQSQVKESHWTMKEEI